MTVALASPTAANTVAADLLLARMTLPSKKAVSPAVVRRDIGKLLDSELTAGQFDDLRSELASAGLLSKGKRNTFALTDAGRERALRFLGVAELESAANWSSVIAQVPVPESRRAVGGRGREAQLGRQTGRLCSQAEVRARRRGWTIGEQGCSRRSYASSSASPMRRRSTACCVRC